MSEPGFDRDASADAGCMRRRASRRQVLGGLGGLALGLGLAGRRATLAAPEQGEDADNPFANVALPPDVGQTGLTVFVPQTGHTLRGSMLDYWRANGGAAVYGNPISEPFASVDGYYSQAFERGIFQYRPEFIDTADPIIRLMPIGEVATAARRGDGRADGRRAGERRADTWQPLRAASAAVARTLDQGGVFVEETGHTLSGAMLDWYARHEGRFYLGHPLSEPLSERGRTAQYFESGVLVAGRDGAALAPLGRELAATLGIETRPVTQGDVPTYDEALFQTTENPDPQGDPAAPGRRTIEVSVGEQQLWARQGDSVVLSTPVSTGIPPNDTAPGIFHVRLKFPKQTMQGFTDGTGEVIAVGGE